MPRNEFDMTPYFLDFISQYMSTGLCLMSVFVQIQADVHEIHYEL